MPIDDKIGNFRIVAPIAKGGMGRVYLARDERTGRQIAIKVLPQNYREDRKRSQYLEREVSIAKELDHPSVIDIFGLYFQNGISYLLMEFMDGGNLRQYIKLKSLNLYDALNLILKICAGIQYIHHHKSDNGQFRSIVHRDIKPENILLSRNEGLKVADFGMSMPEDSRRLLAAKSNAGTPLYMSPEQMRHKGLDIRTDIYSFGLVVYELLTGRLPYDAQDKELYMKMTVTRKIKPPSPSRINKNIPPQLDEIALRALATRPADRYQTVAEMMLDLNRLPAVLKQLSF